MVGHRRGEVLAQFSWHGWCNTTSIGKYYIFLLFPCRMYSNRFADVRCELLFQGQSSSVEYHFVLIIVWSDILNLIVYWCRRWQVFKCEFWRSVNWQNPYMLSYEFVSFGSVLKEKIENNCDTILDKTCSHMLKKGTFPRNTLSKSRLLWNQVPVAPLTPNNVATNVFHLQPAI